MLSGGMFVSRGFSRDKIGLNLRRLNRMRKKSIRSRL